MSDKGYILGIDLGTTNCSVTAIDKDGRTTLVPNSYGEYITPSAVYFTKVKGNIIVGKEAKARAISDPDNLVLFIKRQMGKDKEHVRYNELTKEYKPYYFYEKNYSPDEISSFILNRLKLDAKNYLGYPVTKAVITCPSYFGEPQKTATKQAGIIAGLDVMEIFPEPTAAALSYCTIRDRRSSVYSDEVDTETVLVFDLGGGTFDVTIIKITKTIQGKDTTVITTTGDHNLGGIDYDNALIQYMIDQFYSEYNTDINYVLDDDKKRICLGELAIEVEKAKVALFSKDKESVTITMRYSGATLKRQVSRELYTNTTKELTNRCKDYCDKALEEANMTWEDIDTVLMVGSMSNCLSIQAALKKWSNKDIHINLINPKTCVSEGAAIHGYILEGGHTVRSLAIKPHYDNFEQDKAILAKAKEEEDSGYREDTNIHLVTNVLSSSLCLKGLDRNGKTIVRPILKKNTPYPNESTKAFPVYNSGEKYLSLVIMEGESTIADECNLLGTVELKLDGLLQHGDKIYITFSVDKNGLLEVKAKSLKANLDIVTTIKRKGCLSPKEIQEAIEEDFFLG